MPCLTARARATALALALPCLLTSFAAAQGHGNHGQSDKDLKEISAYTLTMPKYRQFMNAMVNLGKAAQADSSLGDALEDSGNLSIDQLAARYNSVPPIKAAITKAGMTPREVALAQGAFLQAGMSYGLMKQLKLSPDSVVKVTGVSRANLEFFRVNEAEINRLSEEMQARMPQEQASDEAEAGEEADSTE
jgi:hypothetical protein